MSRVAKLGDRAVRVARPPGSDASRLLELVRGWPGVIDAIVTEAWIGVYYDRAAPDLATVPFASLEAASAPPARARRTIELVVRYDGPDLAEVAGEVGLSPGEVARLHQSAEYEVSFLGFLPGFAYLAGLPERLVVPRRSTPRPRVPKNAVAIAGPYTGVYPFASPGGWRLVGTLVDVEVRAASSLERAAPVPPELFSAEGALLRAGDRVRFRSAE
ncbi:MAG TPA: carboxyltransferase domain-containing protein [Polyangiaceae bacterium]|nr:carboxyltransferase domain-containing protein [Polyangiaceae bacterium]